MRGCVYAPCESADNGQAGQRQLPREILGETRAGMRSPSGPYDGNPPGVAALYAAPHEQHGRRNGYLRKKRRIAGITQGLDWRAFDETGRLQYPDFVETVLKLMPMYWARVGGGALFLTGTIVCFFNLVMTWARRPRRYEEPVQEALPLSPAPPEPEPDRSPLRESGASVIEFAYTVERFVRLGWHRTWEGLPRKFTIMVIVSVVVASLFEIIPTFLIKSNVPTIASVRPYTPLELVGRDIYVKEGCYNCHSQMVRPFRAETERYGEYNKPGESVYDHPFQWGSRRIGPDLQRVGGKYPHLWHVRHMEDPRLTTQGSVMPNYPWLSRRKLDDTAIRSAMKANQRVGVPYSDDEVARGAELARAQAQSVARTLEQQGGPRGLADTELIALVAYLQRLGIDIKGTKVASHSPGAGGQ